MITSLSTDQKGDGWVGEYLHGLDQESYAEELPAWFTGCRFSDVARSIYEVHGVLLVGIVLFDYVQVVRPHLPILTLTDTDPGRCCLHGAAVRTLNGALPPA